MKCQPSLCAVCRARSVEKTAREATAEPLRSLSSTSTLTYQAPPMYGFLQVRQVGVVGPIGSLLSGLLGACVVWSASAGAGRGALPLRMSRRRSKRPRA
jgi:hypothetical protein